MGEKELFEAIFLKTGAGIILVNKNGIILKANPFAEKILGYEKDALLEKNIEILIPGFFSKLIEKAKDNSDKSTSLKRTLSAIRKNNSVVPVEIHLNLFQDENGIVFILNLNDISLWKKAEETNALFTSLVNSSSDAILSKTLDGKIISWNPGAEKILGYSYEEIVGQSISILIPEHLKDEENEILKKITKGEKLEHYETERIRKDGSVIPVSLTISPLLNEEGKIIGASKILRDLTALQNAQKKQEKSETYYHSLIEQANDTIYIVDSSPKPKFIDINRSGCELLGYTKEEVLKLTAFDIILEDQIPNSISSIADLNTGKPIRRERILKKKDGGIVETELSAKKMQDGNIMVVVRDISEQKKAQEELQKSEIRFRTLIENNNDIISLMDENFRIIYRSPSATRVLGWTNEEMMQLNGTSKVHPEELDHALEVVKEVLANPGKTIHTLFRYQHKNGQYLWLEGTIINLLSNKNVQALVYNYRDVTERKKAENEIKNLNESLEFKVNERTQQLESTIKELKESDEKFQKVFQSSAAGISITRLSDSVYIDVNTAFEVITGFSRDELIGHTSKELGLVPNLVKREEILEEIRKTGAAKNFEMTVKNKSGNILETLTALETIILKGEKYGLNIIYDITERKKTEEQLISTNKELEAFSYSVSHDLRAPLRAVSGYAQMLNEDYGKKLDGEGLRIIERIKYNAGKMGILIDDLLAFSRLGRKEIQKRDV